MDIVLATKNRNKIGEIKKILRAMDTDYRIYTFDDFPAYQDVEEDGDTFEANAVKKALHVSAHAGMPAIADDSGLEVDALNGAPGVLSARYAGESANDSANLEKLLSEMKDIPFEKRSARFVCCIALAFSGGVKTFSGYVRGRIGIEPKGKKGFGYDPVFYPDGFDRTFAEMSDEEKNTISHRGIALKELQQYFKGRTQGEN